MSIKVYPQCSFLGKKTDLLLNRVDIHYSCDVFEKWIFDDTHKTTFVI